MGRVLKSEVHPEVSYRVERILGQGGTAVAFFATRHSPGGETPVVVKVILPRLVVESGDQANIIVKKEAVALGRLNERRRHPLLRSRAAGHRGLALVHPAPGRAPEARAVQRALPRLLPARHLALGAAHLRRGDRGGPQRRPGHHRVARRRFARRGHPASAAARLRGDRGVPLGGPDRAAGRGPLQAAAGAVRHGRDRELRGERRRHRDPRRGRAGARHADRRARAAGLEPRADPPRARRLADRLHAVGRPRRAGLARRRRHRLRGRPRPRRRPGLVVGTAAYVAAHTTLYFSFILNRADRAFLLGLVRSRERSLAT